MGLIMATIKNILNNIRIWLGIFVKYGLVDFFKFTVDYVRIERQVRENLKTIAPKYAKQYPGESFEKYLNTKVWIFENLVRVYSLGLHRKTPIRILDIGTGAGYFPYICNYYGHIAEAVDLPSNEMYNEIMQLLSITRHIDCIKPFTDLKIKKQYDLITGFMICFNNHKQSDLWHVPEWSYFLKTLRDNNLSQDGGVFFSFNSESLEEPISMSLLLYFIENGAEVSGTTVKIMDFTQVS